MQSWCVGKSLLSWTWDQHSYRCRWRKEVPHHFNTQGFYRFNRLSFEVKSAPGIYQRCIDSLSVNEPHVICSQDNILISGSTDLEHLTNLDRVLKRLSESGLYIFLEKCKFMASSVMYLGHWIDSEGLHPPEEKICSIQDAMKQNSKFFRAYSSFMPDRFLMLLIS